MMPGSYPLSGRQIGQRFAQPVIVVDGHRPVPRFPLRQARPGDADLFGQLGLRHARHATCAADRQSDCHIRRGPIVRMLAELVAAQLDLSGIKILGHGIGIRQIVTGQQVTFCPAEFKPGSADEIVTGGPGRSHPRN
jgi:hypothetical protein